MRVSDYIVSFFINRGITDVFGYPGGMVTHLMDSLFRRQSEIRVHVNYHEQVCAFAACAYAQITHKPGVAFATSGPGATNLITGICNAYYDSIPTVFLTGQVNSTEQKCDLPVRQRGFQETDIVSVVSPVTKLAACVTRAEDIPRMLELAWFTATEGRPGPVLLDIPMDIQRTEIDFADVVGKEPCCSEDLSRTAEDVWRALDRAERPCLLLGAGIHAASAEAALRRLLEKWRVPVLTTMPAIDLVPADMPLNYGFLGSYGSRAANFIAAKADLIISIGARLDIRQVGVHRDQFAPQADIIRVDIDEGELSYPLHGTERNIHASALAFLTAMNALPSVREKPAWSTVCDTIRRELAGLDEMAPNRCIRQISRYAPQNAVITTDVGQNQVWTAQSWAVQPEQRVLFSGGHGAMGYSLPAAIGAYYASGRPVICLTGDGGLQMNIQELAFLAREKLPVTVIVFNNRSLGMIRHFQEMYFDARYALTVDGSGYAAPDFAAVAQAYGIQATRITEPVGLADCMPLYSGAPRLIEVCLTSPTYTYPKLEFGKPNQDQEPLLDRETYARLMAL